MMYDQQTRHITFLVRILKIDKANAEGRIGTNRNHAAWKICKPSAKR